MSKTVLFNGILPSGTLCPVKGCACGRNLVNRSNFSCALLRMYASTKEGQETVVDKSTDDPVYDISTWNETK